MPAPPASGRPDTPHLDGEDRWFGVNMRLHPALLPPGYASAAINARFSDGIPETRKGTVRLGWLNHTQKLETVTAVMEEGEVPGAVLDEGGAAILEE